MPDRRLLAAALALLVALPVAAAGDDYDVKLAEARANLASVEGVAYDRAIGAALQTPALEAKFDACLAAVDPAEELHFEGFFEFPESGAYRVELRPDTPVARCFGAAMEGVALREPPSRPWYNHFLFTSSAGAE
jgi:hypothetical protein